METYVTNASCKGLQREFAWDDGSLLFQCRPTHTMCLLVSVVQGVQPVTTRQPAVELFTGLVIHNAITEQSRTAVTSTSAWCYSHGY